MQPTARKVTTVPSYNVRIFKSWGSRDSAARWSNTYEIISDAAGVGDVGTIVDDLVAAERAMHLGNVQFLSALVSTWAENAGQYNPANFVTLELAGTGQRTGYPAGTELGGNVTFMVKFQPSTGRSGRRFYRGVLLEQDVEMGGDLGFKLSSGAGTLLTGGGFAAFRTPLLPHLDDGASNEKIVLIYDGPSQATAARVARGIAAVEAGGVVVNKRNHRWFDRDTSVG